MEGWGTSMAAKANTTSKEAKANANGIANVRLMELRFIRRGTNPEIPGGTGEPEENMLRAPGGTIQAARHRPGEDAATGAERSDSGHSDTGAEIA